NCDISIAIVAARQRASVRANGNPAMLNAAPKGRKSSVFRTKFALPYVPHKMHVSNGRPGAPKGDESVKNAMNPTAATMASTPRPRCFMDATPEVAAPFCDALFSLGGQEELSPGSNGHKKEFA